MRQVDHDAAFDREQPSSERPKAGVEAGAGPPGARKRLLNSFFGKTVVPE